MLLDNNARALKLWIYSLVLCKYVVALGDGLSSSQGEFLKSLSTYEITIPSRVTREGHHVTYSLHPPHSLRRRSANSEFRDESVHYSVTIENTVHILQLTPNKNLLSPGFVIERKKNRFGNVTDSRFNRIHIDLENCHFLGNVVNQTNTKVALGLCEGMHGFILTDAGEYFIEPIKDENLCHKDQNCHVVYRRSALPASLDPIQSSLHRHKRDQGHEETCGVNDFEKARKQRERWETHNNKQKRQSLSGRRHKRSFSTERYVETLVVVDPSMIKYHKNEHLETYVLTIMNMVSVMFHDASIGNSINIVLVRILLMEDEQEELTISHHADKTLKSFCKFQKTINFQDDDHPNHHDVAVLLTRKNICSRLNEPCGTLGLAQVSGICQPHRSCSINEDTGLALAYTITHELGHNFGMQHDGANNGCEDPPGKQLFIMSPSLVADSLSKSWSNCSKEAITMFIDRDWGYCLDDEPTNHQFNFPVLPPGTMYDADHQCRLQYGTDDATICINEQDVCSNLWCRTDNRCSTHLEAAAEGTICGPNMWCYQGDCVKIGERPEAINGEWGEWTGWSECSRTCGGGISNSERHCDNPAPSNSGKYCLGERKRYRICNTELCLDEQTSFTQVQCEEFNKIPYKNSMFEWEHVFTPESPCQLHCKPKNQFFSALLKDSVTDGTPCTPGTRNMCITGRCRHVGCDYGIDSHAREDRCGVCHGDGSTCTTVKSQFNESEGLGYIEAAVIPAGARNIRVEEVAAVNNFIALQNGNGEYFLNGHWFIQWSGEYKAAGTIIQYQREGNKESVVAAGPLTEPIHVMLLLQSSNPGVVFEYTVPKENITEYRVPEFYWVFEHWTHCTASCGGGSQRSEVVCMEIEAGVVDDKYCNITNKPDDKQRTCNEHLCPARWWTGTWQHCAVTCGSEGIHHRTVICVRSLGLDEQIALDDDACKSEDKPAEVEPCHKKEPCPGGSTWIVGQWSNCSENVCGKKYRSVRCQDVVIGCYAHPMPLSEMRCNEVECSQWTIGEWGECTRTCGNGIQIRQVVCEGRHCDTQYEPQSQRDCYLISCPMSTSIAHVSVDTTRYDESTKEIIANMTEGEHTKTFTTQIVNAFSEHARIKNHKQSALGEGFGDENINLNEINVYDESKHVKSVTDVEQNQTSFRENSIGVTGSHVTSNNVQSNDSTHDISINSSSGRTHWQLDTNDIHANMLVTNKTIDSTILTDDSEVDNKELFVNYRTLATTVSTNGELFHKHRHHHNVNTLNTVNITSEHTEVERKQDDSQRIVKTEDNKDKLEQNDTERDSNDRKIIHIDLTLSDLHNSTHKSANNSSIINKVSYQYFGKFSPFPDKGPSMNENKFKLPSLSDLDKLHSYNLPLLLDNTGLIPLLPDKDNLVPLPSLEDLPPLPDNTGLIPLLSNEDNLATLPSLKDLRPLPDINKQSNIDPLAEIQLTVHRDEDRLTGYDIQTTVVPQEKTAPLEIKLSSENSDFEKQTFSSIPTTVYQLVDNDNIVNKVMKEQSDIINNIRNPKESQNDTIFDSENMFVPLEYPKESMKSMLNTPTQHPLVTYRWLPLNWTECSRQCGDGVKSRLVTCVNVASNETSDDAQCDIYTKPTVIEDCDSQACLSWVSHEWQECPVTCGKGIQKRNVTCPVADSCDPKEKPITEMPCDIPVCVDWVSGPWSKCTKPCDGGERIRLVQCVNLTSQQPSHGCDIAIKPVEFGECNTDPCTQDNAALSIRCEHNKMSYTACHALRKMGQCHKRFVAIKCCKTCSKDLNKKLNEGRPKDQELR